MIIYLNGSPYKLAQNASISELLAELNLLEKRLAVEVNEHIVPRSQHIKTLLTEGDKVELIHAIGGG